MYIYLNSIKEENPGEKWQGLFEKYWPFYKAWFLSEGYMARPGYVTSSGMLEEYMPEIYPVYEQLVALAGGGDLEARFLALYSPPKYLSACTQLAWTKDEAVLIRNYDYDPHKFEGALLYTHWLRPIIAMSDCIWGVLDGMNDAGLCVSLAFGGRQFVGHGFGIPLILRYILETCTLTSEAIAVLHRVPVHMPYNITILDEHKHYATVYISPDRVPVVTGLPIGTNHQEMIEWEDYAAATATQERKIFLETHLLNPDETLNGIIRHFLHPPLYATQYEKGFGTLYTSVYYAQKRSLKLIWPKKSLSQSFENFKEGRTVINTHPDYKSKLSL